MQIGDRIDGYQILDEIPGGGMSKVYKVLKNEKIAVLKTIKNDASEPERVRFKREVRLLQTVNHDNVIKVLDKKLEEDPIYYVMPYCDGSLHDKCASLSEEEKIKYSIQFCEGILGIHQQGITHRDIKPQNALLQSSVVKISDLGLGRFVERDSTTITTHPMGTEGYYPPEYVSNPDSFKNGSKAGDIFMIGKSLYHIFSNGLDPRHIELDKVPTFVAQIISKCIRINEYERYQDVEEIIALLDTYLDALESQKRCPRTITEIKKSYGKVRNAQFNEEVLNCLFFIGNDNNNMAKSLKLLTSSDLQGVFSHYKDKVDSFAEYFDSSIRGANGWIQFEDIEEFVKLCAILIPLCHYGYSKQLLLNLSIEYAQDFNRWDAQRIICHILGNLKSNEVQDLLPSILDNKDFIIEITQNFDCHLPLHVQSVLK